MKVLEYDLINEEKVERALHGNIGAEGKLVGGVGDDADEATILAEYDKLGGLIRKGKYNLKTGCFFDFKTQTPIKTEDVEVIFIMASVDGPVEVSEGEPIPLEVKAEEMRKEKKTKKVKKTKKSIEDEDEE